jgi:DNA polymerase
MVKTARRPAAAAELERLAADAAGCRACDLYKNATQTVFGEGAPKARILMLGEQPGDQEDKAGEPFVGPAGRILDKALAEVEISRDDVYLTNAVKHFKWTAKGKRRIHQRPSAREVAACKQWLCSELAVVDPDVIVVLGATAGQALFGSRFRVGSARGEVLDFEGRAAIATIHPSAVLRAREPADREAQYAGLVDDLRRAVELADR